MGGLFAGGALALWLGILASASPCSMTLNAAAAAYVAQRGDERRSAAIGSLLYAGGFVLVYVALWAAPAAGAASLPGALALVQRLAATALGPMLILVGLNLLGWLRLRSPKRLGGRAVAGRVGRMGAWGAALVGVFLALSFCPTSGGLFFGVVMPLAAQHRAGALLAGLFGVGAAGPVLAVGALKACARRFPARVLERTSRLLYIARTATGGAFIVAGVCLCLTRVYGVMG